MLWEDREVWGISHGEKCSDQQIECACTERTAGNRKCSQPELCVHGRTPGESFGLRSVHPRILPESETNRKVDSSRHNSLREVPPLAFERIAEQPSESILGRAARRIVDQFSGRCGVG